LELTETGRVVYERTYSRPKPDGTKETWPETVERVVDGNLALVPEKYHLKDERQALIDLITEFKLIPGGRHLWASGVKGRQFLFNCHVSGWGENLSDHFEFTFMRLMEGGGVGANYTNSYLERYDLLAGGPYVVHIVCDPGHPDYLKMEAAGVLSSDYTSEWEGAFDIEDSREGWASALVDLVDTYGRKAKNAHRVYDVSRVREEGARLKTFGGRASGPLPLAKMLIETNEILCSSPRVTGMTAMKIDHAIANCVVSGGVRRSARMAMMHWKDPQIFEFLKCKANGDHWTTNISVVVDNTFFAALKLPNNKLGIQAIEVLRAIAEGMLHNGEPGIWNYSLSQVGEPNEVITTNPCGEITLEQWENCNLGNVNLAAFVDPGLGDYDVEEVAEAHQLMARFLIRATFGDVTDSKQAEVLARNRRIGVGHMGVASALNMMGYKYSMVPRMGFFAENLAEWKEAVDAACIEYAHQLRIPFPVKNTDVPPGGTTAKMPGVTEAVHPPYAKYFDRRIRFSTLDPDQWETCMDYVNRGFHVEPSLVEENTMIVTIPTKDILMDQVAACGFDPEEIIECAADLTLDQMLAFQCMYQTYYADNAVSFTANIDPNKYSVASVMDIIKFWGPRIKGMTVFPEKSFEQAPYTRITKEAYEMSLAKSVDASVDDECATGACPVR
jgi:ribonucleoside-triphosphate reductase (thioredoxin)